MSLSISSIVAVLALRRRADDPDRDTAVTQLAKQTAPVVVAVLAAVGGYKYAPIPADPATQALQSDMTRGMQAIADLTTQMALVQQSQEALAERVAEISSRRTEQVNALEQRVRTCELSIAEQRGPRAAGKDRP